MIKIDKVNKYFNRHKKNELHVINNTSLTLDDTGLVALLGESGSGKTTLLNVIGGLDKVGSGNIYIDGKKITSRWSYKVDKIRNLNIGYIFQDYKLVENLSVYDNVALVLKMLGIKDKQEIDKRVKYVLEKVKMYRYRKRPANMLSGGERQRVGIARAIVKNPNIIIADEPTGNLDSRNSIEIMNIIKAISKDRLVILVTHEVNLAKFYASRIIEIADGVITNDYLNGDVDELDYDIDNRIYLKDFECIEDLSKANDIKLYCSPKDKLKLDIVVKNNNIYIRSNNDKKVEVVDNYSNIELIDDHFKKIDKDVYEKYQFDFKNIINENIKPRYCSIFNPITFITNGFKQVFNYSLIKKILLVGFFLSGCFILLATSRIAANLRIDDKDFVKVNRNYLTVVTNKIKRDDYYRYEGREDVNYVLPTDSKVKFLLNVDDFYQTSQDDMSLQASLAGISMIRESNIVYGRMPASDNEVVIDKMVIINLFKDERAKMLGLKGDKDLYERTLSISGMKDFRVVGIVDLNSPSIYVDEGKFINILYNQDNNADSYDTHMADTDVGPSNKLQDYRLYEEKIYLTNGRYPVNDYEVVVNVSNKDEMRLNKEINVKVNGRKLVVVGYYDTDQTMDNYLVNENMIKEELIRTSKNLTIYPKDKTKVLDELRSSEKINIMDSYEHDKKVYLDERKAGTRAAIVSSIVILIISFVEIFLMLRSSFLSRVKEVGIYRAIGVKKKDIYIMFSGEILAITTLASVPGVVLMSYILSKISGISYLGKEFLVNGWIILVALVCIYTFNLLVGLLPVFNTIRKRPAQILSRTDI